jgi:hypothetical protein
VDVLGLGDGGSGTTVIEVGEVHIRQITIVGSDIECPELLGGVGIIEIIDHHDLGGGGARGGDVRDIGERIN